MVETASSQRDLSRTLAAHGVSATPWYAIIDAAQDDTSPKWAAELGLRTQSLYEGKLGRSLDDVAPHLVSFSLKDEFARWLFDNWSGNHGILLQSKARFEDVRRHLRKFTLVRDEDGTKYRFRFYDPRVLRAFLPACSYGEAKKFFGTIACYYAADRSGAAVLVFRWGPRGLTVQEFALERKVPSSRAAPWEAFAARSREPTGSLIVTVVDAGSQDPIVGASVALSGAATEQAVSGPLGKTRFANIATGEYKVFAIDAEQRFGERVVNVTVGQTDLRLSCRRVTELSASTRSDKK